MNIHCGRCGNNFAAASDYAQHGCATSHAASPTYPRNPRKTAKPRVRRPAGRRRKMPYIIRCRAQIAAACLHGKPTERQFGCNDPMSADGTYDRATDSIVCDACYMPLIAASPSGSGRNDELPRLIKVAREYKDLGPVDLDAEPS